MISTMKDGYFKLKNFIVDYFLPRLSGRAFKLLMIIARQTWGWNKMRDRISHDQFIEKTSLSRRSVTDGLQELSELSIIIITDRFGNELHANQRRYKKFLYYQISTESIQHKSAKAKSAFIQRQFLHITKDTDKRHVSSSQKTIHNQLGKQSDAERIATILNQSH